MRAAACALHETSPFFSRPMIDSEAAYQEDLALIARMKVGDDQAFSTFYERHSSTLFGLVFSIIGDAKEAEDALQDALVYLWKTVGNYDPARSRPMTWAVMICRHKAIDHVRARGRQARTMENLLAETEPMASDENTGGGEAINAERRSLVRQALEAMPEDQREAIRAAFFNGLSQVQIAEKTGAPLGTVKARIRRGLLKLRQTLRGKL